MIDVASVQCPTCGGGLTNTRGATRVSCPFCGNDVTLALHPIESMEAMLDRKRQVEPKMNALMDRYADLFVAQDLDGALACYEAFTYLMLWTAYEVDQLVELEAMATPLMRETARQLKTEYTPPVDRGIVVSWASVDALLPEC